MKNRIGWIPAFGTEGGGYVVDLEDPHVWSDAEVLGQLAVEVLGRFVDEQEHDETVN
jgi:ABC-type Zn uptake system ZnuABC Zn-binding protein ZnuA